MFQHKSTLVLLNLWSQTDFSWFVLPSWPPSSHTVAISSSTKSHSHCGRESADLYTGLVPRPNTSSSLMQYGNLIVGAAERDSGREVINGYGYMEKEQSQTQEEWGSYQPHFEMVFHLPCVHMWAQGIDGGRVKVPSLCKIHLSVGFSALSADLLLFLHPLSVFPVTLSCFLQVFSSVNPLHTCFYG